MQSRRLLLVFLIGIIVSVVESRRNLYTKINQQRRDSLPSNVEEHYFKGVKVDHFSYGSVETFDLRWMWNNTFYKDGGPIFFYTGNEGSLETFVTATGLVFDIASQFNAAIIFAEHRFYGQTQPFKENSYKTLKNLGYLTSEQALADFAELLTELKRPNNQFNYTYPASTKVISFGGSYGGMLSAWFRQKYPHIVDGAWAGSAPLIYFRDGGVDPGAFDKITSRTYANSGCNEYVLSNSWQAVLNLSKTESGRAFLNNNTVFQLDPRTQVHNETEAWNLNFFIREAIEYMAMVDYPYSTGFLTPLPPWPTYYACIFANATGTDFTDQQLVEMIGRVANVYYNYNQVPNYLYCIDDQVCGDVGTGGLGNDTLGWPWQECSEIVIPMCSEGSPNDIFWNECGDDIFDTLRQQCLASFSNLNWTEANWNIDGVKTLYGLDISSASNLILTQGHLDPWSGGGFNSSWNNPSRGIYVLEIPDSAHHLDLRQPNTCDPVTVTNARFQLIQVLSCWVNGCTNPPTLSDLPPSNIPIVAVCEDIVGGYPWNQVVSSTWDISVMMALLVCIMNMLL